MKGWFGTKALLGGAVALLGLVGEAGAIPSLVFDQDTDGGQVAFSGSTLTGTDVVFEFVTGFDTPSNSGVRLYCDGNCLLDFETGDILSESGGEYEWAGGGTYTLVGDLWTLPGGALGGGSLIASGTLLSGSWDSPVEGDILFVGGMPVSLNIEGTGFDVKNADLAAFYGLGTSFVFANTNISSNITSFVPGDEGNFEAVIVEADLANFQSPARVPEPGTLILLGLGLAAVGVHNRRRSRG